LKILFFDFIFKNSGKTDPLLPRTFPYLTTENEVLLLPAILLADIKSLSEQSLVAPYKFTGATALSVDKANTLKTFLSNDFHLK
jgi:hypothetical protein